MIVRVPPVVGGAAIVLLTCILSISSARTFEFQGANQTQRIRDLTAHISLNSSHPVVTIDFVG
jgi:cell division septal protein FtsQ